MSWVLKLPENRYDITAVDRPQFSGSDDTAAGFIIVFQLDDFQIFADRFQYQKLVFKLGRSVAWLWHPVRQCQASVEQCFLQGFVLCAASSSRTPPE